MPEAVIVSAVRTPVGRAPKGALSTSRPDDLAALAIGGALGKVPELDKSEIDDVILAARSRRASRGGILLAGRLCARVCLLRFLALPSIGFARLAWRRLRWPICAVAREATWW